MYTDSKILLIHWNSKSLETKFVNYWSIYKVINDHQCTSLIFLFKKWLLKAFYNAQLNAILNLHFFTSRFTA